MINNLDKIVPLLEFPHKDIFYFVQILQRKKDHKGVTLGGSNNNSRLIKAYFITSIDKLHKQWEEMTTLANVFNARVSINLNPRNFQKAAFHALSKISNQMSNGDFYSVHKAYTSVCGEYHAEIDKRWLIDIDTKDEILLATVIEEVRALHEEINNQSAEDRKPGYRTLAVIPSKSGYHLITHPFNLAKFSPKFPELEIHKNNPTNLFIP